MIKVEKDGEQERERNSQKHIANSDMPKINKPATICCREERLARWQCRYMNVPHMSNVDKSSEEDNRQRRAIVFNKLADMPHKQIAIANQRA